MGGLLGGQKVYGSPLKLLGGGGGGGGARPPQPSTPLPTLMKVYTDEGGIKSLYHGLSICTGDNPLAK